MSGKGSGILPLAANEKTACGVGTLPVGPWPHPPKAGLACSAVQRLSDAGGRRCAREHLPGKLLFLKGERKRTDVVSRTPFHLYCELCTGKQRAHGHVYHLHTGSSLSGAETHLKITSPGVFIVGLVGIAVLLAHGDSPFCARAHRPHTSRTRATRDTRAPHTAASRTPHILGLGGAAVRHDAGGSPSVLCGRPNESRGTYPPTHPTICAHGQSAKTGQTCDVSASALVRWGLPAP